MRVTRRQFEKILADMGNPEIREISVIPSMRSNGMLFSEIKCGDNLLDVIIQTSNEMHASDTGMYNFRRLESLSKLMYWGALNGTELRFNENGNDITRNVEKVAVNWIAHMDEVLTKLRRQHEKN